MCVIFNAWWSWWNASAKSSSKLNKFLHCEANQLIQHIIVQDQDGQNNNTYIPSYFAHSIVSFKGISTFTYFYEWYVVFYLHSYLRCFRNLVSPRNFLSLIVITGRNKWFLSSLNIFGNSTVKIEAQTNFKNKRPLRCVICWINIKNSQYF